MNTINTEYTFDIPVHHGRDNYGHLTLHAVYKPGSGKKANNEHRDFLDYYVSRWMAPRTDLETIIYTNRHTGRSMDVTELVQFLSLDKFAEYEELVKDRIYEILNPVNDEL
jgi:hypothetical protein